MYQQQFYGDSLSDQDTMEIENDQQDYQTVTNSSNYTGNNTNNNNGESRQKKKIKIQVDIHNNDQNETYSLPQIPLKVHNNNNIKIQELIDVVIRNYYSDLDFKNQSIFLWDLENRSFLYISEDLDLSLDVKTIQNIYKNRITLRIKSRHKFNRQQNQYNNTTISTNYAQDDHQKIIEQENLLKEQQRNQYLQQYVDRSKQNHNKRVKERTIEFALNIVREWREKQENMITYQDNERIRLNLNHAATLVGLSRKTLDDYSLQIKKGKQFGFDFDANLKEKIGILRKFNKEKSSAQDQEIENEEYEDEVQYDHQRNDPTTHHHGYDDQPEPQQQTDCGDNNDGSSQNHHNYSNGLNSNYPEQSEIPNFYSPENDPYHTDLNFLDADIQAIWQQMELKRINSTSSNPPLHHNNSFEIPCDPCSYQYPIYECPELTSKFSAQDAQKKSNEGFSFEEFQFQQHH